MCESYRKWKNWESGAFGTLPSHQRAYFRREFSGTRLPNRARVLEVGFGNGNFLAYARSQGWNVKGVEIDAALVETAREHGFEASLGPELPDGTYDLIVAFDVLEHLSKKELESFLRDIRGRLSVGGHFIARFPNGQSPFGLINQFGDITHKTAIGASMARQLASFIGLEIVAIRNQAIWLHSNPTLAFARLLQRGLAKSMEILISAAFYSRVEPLYTNLIMHLRRSEA